MKIQIFIVTILLIILCSIYCDLEKPNSPQFGSLKISLIFPEDTGLRLKKATITIDRVHIKIINSSNQAIVNKDLAKSGSVFTGDFEVPSGGGYTIEITCYKSSALIYQGDTTNVSVQPGKTTSVDIRLTSTVQAVKIYPSPITLLPNGTQQLNAYAFFPPNNDSIDVTSKAAWSVNPSNAGSFSSPGLFKSSDTYTCSATINASYSNKQDQASITINKIITSVDVIPTSATMSNGETKQFTCTAYYSDGSDQNLTSLATWSVNPTNAGSFPSPGSFKASDTYTGSATINASYSGKQDQASVTIPGFYPSIDVTPSSATMSNGETKQFTCTAYFSDGSNSNVTSSATWSVSPSNAGSFPSPGSFKASDTYTGNATITASYVGKQDQASATINKIVTSIDVTPSSASLNNSETYQFICTAYFSNGSNLNITSSATWSVNPTNAGSFPSPGSFKASDTYTGDATIIAAYGNKQDQASVSINKIITSVDVTPTSATMSNRGTKQFTCTAYFSDGSNQNVTSSATWGINPINAGDFPSPGLFKASDNYTGNAAISASYGGKQDTSAITIVSVTNVEIAINPSSVNFGNVPNRTEKDTIITVKNSNISTGNLTGNISISGSGFYIDIGSGEYNLSPDATKEITVRFAPNADGEQTFTGNLTITHNGTNKSSPILVPLEGKGIGTGRIEVTTPNSETVWTIGDQNVVIEWDSGLLGGNVEIRLLKDYSSEVVITASTDNDGYYSGWDVLSDIEPRDDYRIQVTHTSDYDYGSEFKIVKLVSGYSNKDTYNNENAPNQNYGNESTLVVSESGSSPYKDRWILFDFDFIRNIPSGAKCISAILKLSVFQSGSETGTPFDVTIDMITSDWNEYDVTWNTDPSSLNRTGDVTIPVGDVNSFNYLDITTSVDNALQYINHSTYPYKGFRIRAIGETRDKEKWYYSRENVISKKPNLEVKYYIHY